MPNKYTENSTKHKEGEQWKENGGHGTQSEIRPSRCTRLEPSFNGRIDICTLCGELTFKQHLNTKSTHHKAQAEIKDVQAEMGNML